MFKHSQYAVDALGNVQTSGTVDVWVAGTNQTTRATLFSTNAGAAQANPVPIQSTGLFEFYLADQRFDITVTTPAGSVLLTDKLALDVDSLSGPLTIANSVTISGTTSFTGPVTTTGTPVAFQGRLLRVTYVTTTGTTAFAKGADSSFVVVTVVGAGGGGGGVSAVAGAAASGGGAGALGKRKIPTSSLAASENVIVGTGGTPGANTGTNGGTGGTSSFGTTPFVSCTGGGPGIGSTAASTNKQGGTGGTASSGDVNVSGGAGGGSVSTAAAATSMSGFGGADPMWGGMAQALSGTTGAGVNGLNYGGGASGALGGAANAGGTGANGIVIIEEYS